MNHYQENKGLFLESTVTQHGSHMVMSNVHKNTKRKYVNIDTRFRDEYESNSKIGISTTANYMLTLPERINDVKSIMACTAEIPMTFYNISNNLENNVFKITSDAQEGGQLITIPDGNYDINGLTSAINTQLQSAGIPYSRLHYSNQNQKSIFSNTDTSFNNMIEFNITSTGVQDNSNTQQFKLGWLLGFRASSYSIPKNTSVTSAALIDVNGPRYLYLIIDEFTSGNQNSFHSLLQTSAIKKNILARITLTSEYGFGHILPVNNLNGLLLTDRRSYTGKVDLQRMNVQLVNERGIPMNLNGLDFSFCLEIECE